MVRVSKVFLFVSLLITLFFCPFLRFNGLVAESEGINENYTRPTRNEEIQAMGETGVIVVDRPLYKIKDLLLFEKEGVSVILHQEDHEVWCLEVINQNPSNKKVQIADPEVYFDGVYIYALGGLRSDFLLSGKSSREYLNMPSESYFSRYMSSMAASLDNLPLVEMTFKFSVQIGSKEEPVRYTRKIRLSSYAEDQLDAIYSDPIGEYGYGGELLYTVYRIEDPQFNVFAIRNETDRDLNAEGGFMRQGCIWLVNGEQYGDRLFDVVRIRIPAKATGFVKFDNADTVYKNLELPNGSPLHLEMVAPLPGMEDQRKTVTFDLGRIDQAGKEEQAASESRIDEADVQIILSVEDDATELTPGKRLQYTAAFANPDGIEKTEKNFTFEWSVVDEETGETSKNVFIDGQGRLGASDELEEIVNVEVRVLSRVFGTSASRHLTVFPKLRIMKTEPDALVFYAGEDRSETVKVQLSPDCLPLSRVTWSTKKEGVVEVTDLGDGTALVKPVNAGSDTVIATEWRGKHEQIPVRVLIPVEKVNLRQGGRAIPGKTISIHVERIPVNADNKKVEWYLDVNEEIATVKNGTVRISENTPVGTVITVTCVAVGAKEPVESSIQVVVVEE